MLAQESCGNRIADRAGADGCLTGGPRMAQTLARHSDIRLTLGIYTHLQLHDQTAAIASLPAPPAVGERSHDTGLRIAVGS